MKCPKCTKGKVIVMDIVHNESKQETYRKKKCIDCGHIFYTAEFPVDYDRQLRKDWNANYRQ